jgi:hypothetical protein
VWRHANGTWLTSFPPPEGFQGRQRGEYGNLDYCRTLAPEEQAKVDLWQARNADPGPPMRDSYFARLA